MPRAEFEYPRPKELDSGSLLLKIMNTSIERFQDIEIDSKLTERFGFTSYYTLGDAIEDTINEHIKTKMQNPHDIAISVVSDTIFTPKTTGLDLNMDGCETWDEVFLNIAHTIVQEEIELRLPNIHKENVDRSEKTEINRIKHFSNS